MIYVLKESKKDKAESSLEKFFDEHGIKKPKIYIKHQLVFLRKNKNGMAGRIELYMVLKSVINVKMEIAV